MINFGHGYVGDQGHSSKVKNVDDWLPVTGNRNASWWYATFHNVTAMVGAGVLGLPNAMVYMTWSVSFFSLWTTYSCESTTISVPSQSITLLNIHCFYGPSKYNNKMLENL